MNACTLRRITLVGITVLLSWRHLAAQDADPIIGTWVLNVAKSTFSPGPAPQSESRTYIMEEQKTKLTARVVEPRTYMTVRQEIKATSHMVDADGNPMTREWTIVRDGRDYPMTVTRTLRWFRGPESMLSRSRLRKNERGGLSSLARK
jgi:hypothetical protein